MSERALARIAKNKKTKAKHLWLGECGLEAVPAEIGELVWLESLSLSDEYDKWHRKVWFYRSYRSVNDRQFSNYLTDITALAGLPSLQTLILYNTAITDLAPLSGLTTLQTLDASGTRITDLTPLSGLNALQKLDVSFTGVSDLSPLQALVKARRVRTEDIDLFGEGGIFVSGCPLTIPPIEIVKQGTDAVLNYFRERSTGEVDHLFEAKMLILGEGGAGKTSLLRRLYQPDQPLPDENETTKGIDIYRHDFTLKNGQNFRLNVWDFGGQEIYHATHQFFLTKRSLYLLLDDTRKDHKLASDPGFKYWLDLIDLYGGHSPVLLFQNEKGGRSKEIDFASIKGRYDNVKELYHGNLEHPGSADPLRAAIELFASQLPHIGEELPAAWIKVRADIEARALEVPHITQDEYFAIHARHRDDDQVKAGHLSQYLHDLGVFLHFQHDPLLSRIVILQNRWATDAVYRVLDDEIVKKARGRFTHADCERAWHDATYVKMRPELLALMENFELCYLLPDSTPKTWLAPQLLAAPKHPELANWNQPDDLVLRYHYEFLPKGILSRLMVRLHRFVVAPEKASVNCVLFERETSKVLVELPASGNVIELRARGPERRALLTVISADVDAINDALPGLRDKVAKWIPCHCKDCRKSNNPRLYEEKLLRKRIEDRRMTMECPLSYEDVDVAALLHDIRTDKLPVWANERTVTIFLASSEELEAERDQFDLYFRRLNDNYRKQGIYLKIVRWETGFEAMSPTRSQDEYNKVLRRCDVFLGLFFTKAGKYTEEEFDAAHEQFKKTGLPYVFTYFKDANISTADLNDNVRSLLQFKKKLAALEHFSGRYTSIEDLQKRFRDQLDMVLKKLVTKPGK